MEQYKELLYGNFIKFTNQKLSSVGEADVLLKLQEIEKELELLVGFPEIYTKNIIAVGDGFSSGKSEFINSFINDQSIRLAVGINPVTAIPSYVIASPTNYIRANSSNGGQIDLHEVTYNRMTHDYIKSFGFNLKLIMPFMSIGVSMESYLFSDICLIDTPGYNPASKEGYTSEDHQTALNFIDRSGALIWVIGLDANGTLDKNSIDFIKELDITEKEIFIVLNKADLRAVTDIEDILSEVEDTLSDEDIEYVGISVYSSLQKKEHTFSKQSLFEFIENQNRYVNIKEKIQWRIKDVFDVSRFTIKNNISKNEDFLTSLKSMLLDTLQYGDDELYKRFESRVKYLREPLAIEPLEENLKDIDTLNDKFNKAVDLVFDEISGVR